MNKRKKEIQDSLSVCSRRLDKWSYLSLRENFERKEKNHSVLAAMPYHCIKVNE